MRRTCCLCTVGQVVHTLPEGKPVRGVTLLGDELYVLRQKERDQVEVYDVTNYHLQRCLTIPSTHRFTDMTSCENYVYVANYTESYMYGLYADEQGAGTWWCIKDKPVGLSVNAAHNLLVTCDAVRKIKQFNLHGDFLRAMTLPDDVINPRHAIELKNFQFVVCHGFCGDAVHRVCKISADGHHIVQSHGGQPGSDIGHYDVPRHLAADNNEFVFVADVHNQRVTLLSPTLDYVGQVVSRDDVKWSPSRLYLDTQRHRLYVTDNENVNGKYTAGRVVVFSV